MSDQPITEKRVNVTVRDLVYIVSLIVALLGQWFSHRASLNESVLLLKNEDALLRLELQMVKTRLEKLEK